MEILICIVLIIYIRRSRNISNSTSVKIENLPIKLNPKGYFEEDAFTEVYYKLKN